nr:stalk domain-containing protein [uncultured Cellulosilyticum sp.]
MLLVFLMIFNILPSNLMAEVGVDMGSYKQITTRQEVTTGQYILVADAGINGTYYPDKLDGTWVTTKELTSLNTNSAREAWTITVNEDETVKIADPSGIYIAPKGGNENGIKNGEYNWEFEGLEDGTFAFKGAGEDTVILAVNKGVGYKIRAYKNSTVANNAGYITNFALFKYTGEAGEEEIPPTEGDSSGEQVNLKDGDEVVIYNVSAKGVLAGQDDNETSPSVESVAAKVSYNTVDASNGARVFTVETNGEYFRFRTENDGYLCSNGTGSNAFYQKEASDDADWKLESYNGGYSMESRTAKFNDKYSQYLEYYSGSYKTYSKHNETDKDIFTFKFYPCSNTSLTEGVVNEPTVNFTGSFKASANEPYELRFTIDAVFGVKEDVSVTLDETALEVTLENDVYTAVIPAEKVKGDKLIVSVAATDLKEQAISATAEITVIDIPVINKVTPAEGSQTGDNKKPEITVAFGNAGENPTVSLTLKAGSTTLVENAEMTVEGNEASYIPTVELEDKRYNVTVVLKRADGKETTKSWSFTVGEAEAQLYFGQLHSHTTYSDGSGTLEAALDYIKNLPESANVDFVAFTDHSNYFDEKTAANPEEALYDMSKATANSQAIWNKFKNTVNEFNAENTDVIALGGFEMTWSGGPGHINTFNTPGIVSRNNATLNNKTNDAGLKAYYNLLSQPEGEDSLSQLNHPGKTFGTFADFAYWNATIDTRVKMVEVGNGEGAIGSGGYYPSYEQYTIALDKGWHVAPTNNQDNHKGKWGNANDARDVILTDDFTEQGLYNAIRERRMYATEDKNLEIYYTLNGEQLGSIISEKPETVEINVEVNDPDSMDKISKVEVIVNSGKVAYTWDNAAELESGVLSCKMDASDAVSYYYIRVTQEDGDLAVTAPVWVGETMKIGISSVECGTSTPVTGEELTLTTNLFNAESADVKVKKITYTTNGSQILYTDNEVKTIPSSSSIDVTYGFMPEVAKMTTITVTAVIEVSGEELTFTKDITLDILEASKLAYIGIDASHYNEYVAGNYKDSMGNFGELAAGQSVRTVQLNTSEDLIKACENAEGKYKALVLTAPSRRNGSALRDPYLNYTDAEIAAIKAFNQAGGTVVVAGWSDVYESYGQFPEEDHMSAQQNKLLAALGSSIRIGDDGTNDNTSNGGQSYRLYFSTYNLDSFLMEGVEVDEEHPNDTLYSQVFSQYGGASIYTVDEAGNPTSEIPETVTPVVYGHATTYSKNTDKVGVAGDDIPKYPVAEGDDRLLVLASEQIGSQGLIVVSGAAFMSNFEVQVTVEDTNAEKNYSNYNICENLVKFINPTEITSISEVQAEESEGIKYTVEGIVTSNASGYDKDTAFFDCIYIQDETAGINCFPVSGDFKIGDKVRVTGTTSSYQGERQLAVTSIEKIGTGGVVAPEVVTAKQINDGSVLGKLISLSGNIVAVEKENGLIQTIMVKDKAGDTARVFIDGYITTSYDVEHAIVGNDITVVGLASYDESFAGIAPRIRIRDRKDVVCTEKQESDTPNDKPSTPPNDSSDDESGSGSSGSSSSSSQPNKTEDKTLAGTSVVTKSKIEVTFAKVSDAVAKAVKAYNEKNNNMIMTAGVAVASKDFTEPAMLTLTVDKAAINDTDKLAIVKIDVNEKGELAIKLFGGKLDAEKGTVSTYVNETGNYFVAKTEGFTSINLVINNKTSIINDNNHALDAAPVIVEERTMVPLRFIAEAFGAEIKWDNKKKTVGIAMGDQTLEMTINKEIEGFGAAPMIMNGRTMVPIRYISERLGANVIWVPSAQEIVIVK